MHDKNRPDRSLANKDEADDNNEMSVCFFDIIMFRTLTLLRYRGSFYGFSCSVNVHDKARLAANGHSPLQKV